MSLDTKDLLEAKYGLEVGDYRCDIMFKMVKHYGDYLMAHHAYNEEKIDSYLRWATEDKRGLIWT